MYRVLLILGLLVAIAVVVRLTQDPAPDEYTLVATFADGPNVFYVTDDKLDVRSAPKDGAVVSQLNRGQKVFVFEKIDGWARVSHPDSEPRWVSTLFLSRKKTAPAD